MVRRGLCNDLFVILDGGCHNSELFITTPFLSHCQRAKSSLTELLAKERDFPIPTGPTHTYTHVGRKTTSSAIFTTIFRKKYCCRSSAINCFPCRRFGYFPPVFISMSTYRITLPFPKVMFAIK